MIQPDGVPPGVAAAVGEVQVTIDRIEEIAKTTVARAEQEATTTSTGFRNLDVATAAFSDVPAAQTLATQHRAAHDVFVDTVKGVVEDLREFQRKLIASANAHRGNDDAVYATLVSLGTRYRGHRYHSQQNWRAGAREHASELDGRAHRDSQDGGSRAGDGGGEHGASSGEAYREGG